MKKNLTSLALLCLSFLFSFFYQPVLAQKGQESNVFKTYTINFDQLQQALATAPL